MKKKKYSKELVANQSLTLEKPHKKKTLLYVLGGFIILVMVGSILGYYGADSATSAATYQGHTFVQTAQGWMTIMNGQQLAFQYHPRTIANYTHIPLLFGQKVYILFNPQEYTEKSPELQYLQAYLRFTGHTVNFACTHDKNCSDLPILSCTNEQQDILFYTQGTATALRKQDSCTVLTYQPGEETQAHELFAYTLLGIL